MSHLKLKYYGLSTWKNPQHILLTIINSHEKVQWQCNIKWSLLPYPPLPTPPPKKKKKKNNIVIVSCGGCCLSELWKESRKNRSYSRDNFALDMEDRCSCKHFLNLKSSPWFFLGIFGVQSKSWEFNMSTKHCSFVQTNNFLYPSRQWKTEWSYL